MHPRVGTATAHISTNNLRKTLCGPAAFLTSPDSVFSYGSEKNTTREHYHVLTTRPRIRSYLDSGLFVPAAQREKPYYPIHAPNQFLSHMLELIQLSRDPDMHDFAVAKFEYMLLLLGSGPVRREGNSFYQPDLERIVHLLFTPANYRRTHRHPL